MGYYFEFVILVSEKVLYKTIHSLGHDQQRIYCLQHGLTLTVKVVLVYQQCGLLFKNILNSRMSLYHF